MTFARLTASIFLLAPCFVWATDINDMVNYQPSPAKIESKKTQAYTLQDIINKLPNALNDHGVYKGFAKRSDDAKAIAFDEENFGECEYFYIHEDANNFGKKYHNKTYGAAAYSEALQFTFSANDNEKVEASKMLKLDLEELERDSNYRDEETEKRCPDRQNYIVRFKEIINAVMQAAPTILAEKQRMVEIANAESDKKHRQANEMARAKKQAEESAKAENQAKELAIKQAEAKGREERENKLKSCQATNQYELFKVSMIIFNNQGFAKRAELTIQREKEGAKISGYVDANKMHKAGDIIAGANKANKTNFELYKQLGGAARNIESVQALPNPCEE